MALSPDRLGPFELLRRLGAGGMAETFLAIRRGPAGFEQRACIKRILPAYESDQDFVSSFLLEARTSATLRHANIVQVLDFGFSEPDGSHYLALELIDGLDLRALIQHGAQLDSELVTLIAMDVAAALAYAHAGDEDRPAVIHRDVSPSNVLVSRNGELKLTDFGIARVVGGALNTASGVIKGKVPYMPPEYIDGGHFDGRGDLFALGVMMFELLHGYRPYDGGSELDTLRRIAKGEREPFSADAGAALTACVERLLEPDRERRFRDARELLEALPTVHVHRARHRLAELVRVRTSRAPGDSRPSWSVDVENARTVAATPSKPPSRPLAVPAPALEPTTRAASSLTLPSRRALWALAASSALLCAVVFVAVLRLPRGPANAAMPPGLPTVPEPARRPSVPSEALTARAPFEATPTSTADTAKTERAKTEAVNSDATKAEVAATSASSLPEPRSDEPRSDGHSRRHAAELSVVVLPFGEIWIDGKHMGQSPLRSLKLPPGTHEVGVGEGRAREKRTIHLSAGGREELVFSAAPRAAR